MTPLQRLDPRTKFLAVCLVGIQVFLVGTGLAVAAGGVLAAAGLLASGVSSPLLLRRLSGTLWFGLVIVALQGLTAGGTVLLSIGPGYVTAEGLREGAYLYVRVLIMLAASMALSASTPLPALVEGLESGARLLPRRVSPVMTALSMTLTLAPVLVRSARSLRLSLRARGLPATGSPLHRLAAIARGVPPFLILALRTADDLALAMDARSYVPGARRTLLRTWTMKPADHILLAAIGLLTLTLLIAS